MEYEYPYVSIVVPVLNQEVFLNDCLLSILKSGYPGDKYEIIVVDNASTDNTASVARKYPVKYLYESKRGVSYARNKGILNSSGEIIAFTDADCIVTKNWIREIVRNFKNSEVGAVAGEIVPYLPVTPAELYASRIRHLSPQIYLNRPVLPFAVFANLAFRREVFDRTGLLDGLFSHAGESTDFCTRFFRNTDLKMEYAPKALVFHRHRKSTFAFIKQQWNYGRSHALLYIKYRKEIRWDIKKSMLSNIDLIKSFLLLIRKSVEQQLIGKRDEDLNYYYFEFLKKFSERLGFIRESLSRGYLYL